jgi:hypothetical protein
MIPSFVFFLKLPALHLPAYITEEIQYYYADIVHMYKAAGVNNNVESECRGLKNILLSTT